MDPTEKAENADSSENVTDKRNQKSITPNTRLTIFVQQSAANTRLTQKLRLLQRRQSEQHRFADFIKFQQISTCTSKWGGNFRRMFRGILRSDETQQELQKSAKFEISRNAMKFRTREYMDEEFTQKHYQPQPVRADYRYKRQRTVNSHKRLRKRVVKPTYKARRWPMPGEGTRERAESS